ncbi:MAG: hypothetical protein IT371_28640 [Deltaproteobacteria bacterium]|nr:hypothetical protein [Deltaproteobacteria bacterium]
MKRSLIGGAKKGGFVGGLVGFVFGSPYYAIKDGFGGLKQSVTFKGKFLKNPGAKILTLGVLTTALMAGQPEQLPVIGQAIGWVGDKGTEIAPWVGTAFKAAVAGPLLWASVRAGWGLATGWLRGAINGARGGAEAGATAAGVGALVDVGMERALDDK